MSNHNKIIKYNATALDGSAAAEPMTYGLQRDMPGMSDATTMYEVELQLHLDADSWHKMAEFIHSVMNAQCRQNEPQAKRNNALMALAQFDGD